MIAADRQTFVVHLRPEKHCLDPIRALRATLKNALRSHGLRCTTIRPADEPSADLRPTGSQSEGRKVRTRMNEHPRGLYAKYLDQLIERHAADPAPDIADLHYWNERRRLEDEKAKTLRGDR